MGVQVNEDMDKFKIQISSLVTIFFQNSLFSHELLITHQNVNIIAKKFTIP